MPILRLAGIQLLLELLLVLGQHGVSGGIGLILPAVGLFGGAFGWIRWQRLRRSLDRAELKALAAGSALLHLPAGAAAWLAHRQLAPAGYPDGPGAALLGALAIGILAAAAALVLTLCAGDAALGDEDPADRTRRARYPSGPMKR